jgi:hypothetical protein
MSYEINNFNEIDKNKIKLGKTFKYSVSDNYNLINIYYLNETNTNTNDKINNNKNNKLQINENKSQSQNVVDEKIKLIIQTPLMYLPNSIIYFNDKPFLELSFNNEDNDKDVSYFKQWIIDLEHYMYKLIKKRTSLNIQKENMISIIKQKNANYKNSTTKLLVPINTNISKCILNDDLKKSKILFNWEIPVPTYGISIIWVKNIWVKNNKWGINLFMYASRVMNSHILYPIDCLGMDTKSIKKYEITTKFKDNEKMSIEIGQIPEYTMFFKMLKVGIPKDAIKQKIELAGLDKRILDYPENAPYTTVLHYISNPHLGSYVKNNDVSRDNNINNTNNTSSVSNVINNTTTSINLLPKPFIKLDLLNNINKGGFKLKKVDINENENEKQKMKDKILNKINNNGIKVPSLGDIQGALSKLKKIDLDC